MNTNEISTNLAKLKAQVLEESNKVSTLGRKIEEIKQKIAEARSLESELRKLESEHRDAKRLHDQHQSEILEFQRELQEATKNASAIHGGSVRGGF
jgi:predicted  nucleic acid-binding Zn-ribbon protein